MAEMKSLTLNGTTYDSFVDKTAREGASINVTAEVGQTIIVKEVDENGKPTAWEAVDYQEKICGEEYVEFLENTEVTLALYEEMGCMFASIPFDKNLQPNISYIVTFNGETYINTFNEEMNCIGNAGALMGGESTGEPYIITSHEGMLNIIGLTDVENVSISILEVVAAPINARYLPDLPYYDFVSTEYEKFLNSNVDFSAPEGLGNFFKQAYIRGFGRVHFYAAVRDEWVDKLDDPVMREFTAVVPIVLIGDLYRFRLDIGDFYIAVEYDGDADRWRYMVTSR